MLWCIKYKLKKKQQKKLIIRLVASLTRNVRLEHISESIWESDFIFAWIIAGHEKCWAQER